MYKVMIVDDEPDIRVGIHMKVDWERLGLTPAAEASNGTEALELLAGQTIDIVITDMNMPMMNGVSFLEACREQYPALRTIVITGYEDFQYTRAAIRTGSRDYLLKPVARDELETALLKVIRELDEERRLSGQRELLEWRLSQYYKEMKEHFIVHIVKEERGNSQALRDRAKLFELEDWGGRSVRFVTVGIRERASAGLGHDRTPDKLRLPFELICRELAGQSTDGAQVFHDVNYPALMHYIVPEEVCPTFAEQLRRCVASHLSLEPAIGIGQPVTGFQDWREGYMSALLAWNMTDKKDILNQPQSQPQSQPVQHSVLSEETSRLLRTCLLRGDMEAFEETVRYQLNESFGVSHAHFVKMIFLLYLLIETASLEPGVRLEGKNELWIRPELVLGLHTVNKAEQFLVRMARQVHSQLKESAGDPDRSLFQAVEQFIESHYRYDLNLTMVAERFNYHPSYFSELFKAKMGMTFIQYVTEVRMAQAIHLLEETSLSLWDIAELTGFANASYFSSKFKKLYGLSPSEYRQSRSGQPYETRKN